MCTVCGCGTATIDVEKKATEPGAAAGFTFATSLTSLPVRPFCVTASVVLVGVAGGLTVSLRVPVDAL